jgi:two-component system phosphate regulon sensor histidine kinase PhoR
MIREHGDACEKASGQKVWRCPCEKRNEILMQSDEAITKPSIPERFAALSRIGVALLAERDEGRLLHLIAQTACELTGASFAAFSLRPLDESGRPLGLSEGNRFHLAAVVGVTKEQETLFRETPLGGEGLLAPIFRSGVSVRIADFLDHLDQQQARPTRSERDTARDLAAAYAQGALPVEQLRSLGVRTGHPLPRSFLGVPLLDLEGHVRGGLLLGHEQPNQFSKEDELLLVGLASQAAVALENGRLARASQLQTQELQAIFESSADGITLIGQDGTILRENRPARQLRLHLEQENGGAQALEHLLFAPARLAFQEQKEQRQSILLQHPLEQQEYVITAAPLRLPTQPITGKAGTASEAVPFLAGSVVVWHDVTEIRRLLVEKQHYAETETRYALLQRILDELPISVYLVHGPQARLVLANRATVAVWGTRWLPEQPMQEFLAEHHIRITQTDGRPLPFEQLATIRAVRQQETIQSHQEVIRHADGTLLPVAVSVVVLDMGDLDLVKGGERGPDTHVAEPEVSALVVHQDISTLKEAEQLKDEFISIAAHELRTPLAVLKGFAQTLLIQIARKHGPELAEWQMEALGGIDQATGRLVELVDNLLDVSRLQVGHFPLYPIPTDFVALIQRVMTRIQLTTERHRLTFHAEFEHLVVVIDPPRMEQVLTNLLTNAIKYSPTGGMIAISAGLCQQRTQLRLSIQDQGIGIPQTQQAQIFGRFARAENARLQGIGGTGLGLYLCRELVEQHQGHIWFESVEGEGTTFFLTLPFLEAEENL